MDYSLLVGILHEDDEKIKDKKRGKEIMMINYPSYFRQERGGIYSTNKENERIGTIYYIGIIDILQHYNFRKKVENKIKTFREPAEAISCIAPKDYSARFLQFIEFVFYFLFIIFNISFKPSSERTSPPTSFKPSFVVCI